MSWTRSLLGTTSIVRTQPLREERRMKSTIASDLPIGSRDWNPASAGHVARHVPGHRPWLRASRVIGSRSVSTFTLAGGICLSFVFSAQLKTDNGADYCAATDFVYT